MNKKPPSVRCENCGLVQRWDKDYPICRHCMEGLYSCDIIEDEDDFDRLVEEE
jgi:hypothetical protein